VNINLRVENYKEGLPYKMFSSMRKLKSLASDPSLHNGLHLEKYILICAALLYNLFVKESS